MWNFVFSQNSFSRTFADFFSSTEDLDAAIVKHTFEYLLSPKHIWMIFFSLYSIKYRRNQSTCDILASNAVVASKQLPLFSKTSNRRIDGQHYSITCGIGEFNIQMILTYLFERSDFTSLLNKKGQISKKTKKM